MVGKDQDFEQYPKPDWKPVQVNKDRGNVVIFLGVGYEMGSSILDALEFLDVAVA